MAYTKTIASALALAKLARSKNWSERKLKKHLANSRNTQADAGHVRPPSLGV